MTWMEKEGHKRKSRGWKIALGVVLGLLIAIPIALKLVLTPSFLTKTVNDFAAQYVDGQLHFGRIEAKLFPHVGLSLSDAVLTYPHDRFAAYDSVGVRSFLRRRGRGAEQDTLASFGRLFASVNLVRLLGGNIHVSEIALDKARIYAHQYDDSTANWQIFRTGSSEDDKDTTASSLPPVNLHRIALTGRPRIVYTSLADTLFAAIRLKEMAFRGRIDISDLWHHRIHFQADSLFVAGRLPADTLALGVDALRIDQHQDEYTVDLHSKAFLRTRAAGRMMLPIDLSGRVSFPEQDFKDISARDLAARIATLSLRGEADVKMRTDSTYVRAELSLDTCSVDKTLNYFARNLMPSATRLKTDAVISLTALCQGWYIPDKDALPELIAELVVPSAAVAYEGIAHRGRLAADINAQTDRYGKLGVTVNELEVDIPGASLSGTGSADDVLGDDPLVQLDVAADASLGKLRHILPDGILAEGDISAALSGMILLSDMSLYNFSKADLEGFVKTEGLRVDDVRDTLTAYLGRTDIRLGKAGKDSLLGHDVLGFKGQIDTLFATYGENIVVRGSGIDLKAQNAARTISEEFGHEVHPIVGTLGARNLVLTGADSLYLSLRRSENQFKYSNRDDGGKTLPILAVSSTNRGLFLRSGPHRVGLRNASLYASAVMKGSERTARRAKLLDSLQRIYPGIERDSLMRHHIAIRRAARAQEDYLQEADFRKSDIKIDVGDGIRSYFRDWTLNGGLKVGSGRLVTPYLPLRNTLSDIEGNFDNNHLSLKNLTFKAGRSDLSAAGRIDGLRQAMSGRGTIKVKLDLTSNLLDADELLPAVNAGLRFKPETVAQASTLSDEAYMEELVSAADTMEQGSALIVLPANVDATMTLQGNEIKYTDLDVNWFASDIRLKQRTLQVTNTVATSNMGDIYFEGFYATRTKKDLKAGFDLNLVDITADKVITLIPQVDSIMPMLKSFQGNLDCELAATTEIDTAMNILPATINGVMRIKGSDLSIHDNDAFRKVARILMFKDKQIGRIADMSVQGLVADNMLEIFPFVLSVDRYSLAMSGLQGLDTNFDYHVSVLKSPLPFRFGVDLFGNFDDWKWKLVRPRYKDANVPVFTKELNDVQLNLVTSIHDIFTRSVDEVMRAQAASGDALSAKAGQADVSAGSLDEASVRQLDSLRYAYEHPEQADSLRKAQALDSLLNARIDEQMQQMSQTQEPEEKTCWLKRLFTCRKKEQARKEEEQ